MSVAERVIGPFTFPSRKAAVEHIQRILHETPHGTPLTGDYYELVRALVYSHPRATEKIGPGIDKIEVRVIEYGAPGFWLHRTDGTAVDFSYRRALDGAPSHTQAVKAALRWEIQDQIDAFRTRYFTEHSDETGAVICPLTGLRLTLDAPVHVDHVIPFVELAEKFVAAVGGYDRIAVEPDEVGGRSRLRNREHAAVWQEYHRRCARLRVVHPSANLARYRRAS